MQLKIYMGYHKIAPIFKSPHVVPVHLGAQGGDVLPEMIGDDTGDHISDKNDTFCELTALYWAWKNDHTSDYIGLMHYRRLLDLTDETLALKAQYKPLVFEVDTWLERVRDFAHSPDLPDIVLPPVHHMGRTIEDNYAHSHNAADFDLARTVIQRQWPDYMDSFEEVAGAKCLRLGNIALMKRPHFEAYCTWLFDILFAVETLRDASGTQYRPRFAGHLSERLFTVYIHHLEKTRPDIRLAERPIRKLSNALIMPFSRALRFDAGNPVNLAVSCDTDYVPHTAAMLVSVLRHLSPDRPLNVLFLHDDVPEYRVNLLREIVLRRPQTDFIAVNTAHYFADGYHFETRAPSNATYNRFLLFRLFPAMRRVLYLDGDVIVRADIARLFDSDLGGKAIGGVPDWIMTRSLTGQVQTADPRIPDLLTYQQEELGLSLTDCARYINAGVLLIDISALYDPETIGRMLCDRARNEQFLFRDQDILNAAFAGDIAVLDARWNVFNSPADCYTRVPMENYQQAMRARRDPWIIHYADRAHKPWQLRAVPEAQYYWQALIETPFYGEVIARQTPKRRWAVPLPTKRLLRKIKMKIRRRIAWGRRFLARLWRYPQSQRL